MRAKRKRDYIGPLLAACLLLSTVAIAAPPPGKGGGNGGGSEGSDSAGPSFTIELLNYDGFVVDLNDNGDVLLESETYDGSFFVYTYAFGTTENGSTTLSPIVLPAGWKLGRLRAMNNAREIVGYASYDVLGDGIDIDQDGILEDGDIMEAGIRLSPDANNNGAWELDVIFPGPYRGRCAQINNQGDIVGQDDVPGSVDQSAQPLLYRPDAAPGEEYEQIPYGYGEMSDRDDDGHIVIVESSVSHLPRKYETRTGEVTFLPTFERTTYIDAAATSVNVHGEVVGRADRYPSIWSPTGDVSRIPGWSKTKSDFALAYANNDLGEVTIVSEEKGAFFYSPTTGLVELTPQITNPEEIPEGHSIERLVRINEWSQMAGELYNGEIWLPFLIHPVPVGN